MIEYIILAILQGLIEWLPISSSGQVVIFSINFLGISPNNAYSLSIWLHLGTTLAVLIKMRKDFFSAAKTIFFRKKDHVEKDVSIRNWIIYATIGTAITAIPLYFIFRYAILEGFSSVQGEILTLIVSGLLIITGFFLLYNKRTYGDKNIESISKKQLLKDSTLSGLIQGIAILPGISRSGVTTSSILFENYREDQALRLSFLMSAPVAIASIIVDILFGDGSVFGSLDISTILITTAISFMVGYLTMEILIKIANKLNFSYFCIIYGVITYIVIIPVIVFS